MLTFLIKRMSEGRIIECHGDLRPEHICLAPKPVIIDRVEFSRDLRIMDVAEELSSLSLECDILDAPSHRTVVLQQLLSGRAGIKYRTLIVFL